MHNDDERRSRLNSDELPALLRYYTFLVSLLKSSTSIATLLSLNLLRDYYASIYLRIAFLYAITPNRNIINVIIMHFNVGNAASVNVALLIMISLITSNDHVIGEMSANTLRPFGNQLLGNHTPVINANIRPNIVEMLDAPDTVLVTSDNMKPIPMHINEINKK
mgnify:CR=1 FL=1